MFHKLSQAKKNKNPDLLESLEFRAPLRKTNKPIYISL